MQNKKRTLYLDIFDYSKKRLCSLYDCSSNASGQATDVVVTTERNGWKELSFILPSVCNTENGQEDNYRKDYLKADFLIRLIDDVETDWFIISEPRITHNAFSKTIQVTAGHVAQLLKFKNLGLEFSDDEGNNVGTAKELAATILEGTGWTVGNVYPFAEKNSATKYRSLKASAKTGAFKLMTMMCELFDAKPIYHGDSRTVDIIPINPFSEPAPGKLPDLGDNEVVELHYGTNVSNVTRTLNTENIVTKLYASGAYGDKTSGYCGIDECTHAEFEYTLDEDCIQGQTYYFEFEDAAGEKPVFHFKAANRIAAGSTLVYSLLDPCSMMYIWDDNNQNAYPVKQGTVGIKLPAQINRNDDVKNWFQFIMNFDYYREVGLLTNDMIRVIADYQRMAPKLYQDVSNASMQMSEAQTTLSETIGYLNFCKLDVDRILPSSVSSYASFVLNKENYEDGVIYRTDYDVSANNRFKWRVTDSLNTDGDPINSAAAMLYVVHDTNPVTWDKMYLKALDDEEHPSILTFWSEAESLDINVESDEFFLFAYNGINGHLGTLESNDESAVMSLEETLRVATVDHPVIFSQDPDPSIMRADVNGYGWLWQYDPSGTASNMYFAYADAGDAYWRPVYFQDDNPGGAEENSYWFNWRDSVLYRRNGSVWHLLDTTAEKKIAALFASVYMLCKARDRYYQGVYENYTYTVPDKETLSPGNYFFENAYNSYWAFTTNDVLNSGDTLTYNYSDAWVTQKHNGVDTLLKPKGYRFDNVGYHPSNILIDKGIENGSIDDDGVLSDSHEHCRSQSFISVVPLTRYICAGSDTALTVHFYDDRQGWMQSEVIDGDFTTPSGCTYIRLCAQASADNFTSYNNVVIHADNLESTIVVEDLNYIRLPSQTSGENIGLLSCVSKFKQYANLTYDKYYSDLLKAQNAIVELEIELMLSLGDLYREGWWSDASYVDGDETKLYEDALDNLKEVSKPEATYNIEYLDTYDANSCNADYGVMESTTQVSWPDLSMCCAVHLIDPEISVNTWAFIDKIQKCYDKPWKTKIYINTNLSTIAQRNFTDVMSNIATVASEVKGKTSYYDKTIGSSATTDDVTLINAEINKNERELLSTMNRVEEIGGISTKFQSQIKQTSEMISSEVLRATQAEGKVLSEAKSLVKQTADSIKKEVSETYATEESVKTLKTTVDQTKDSISSVVSLGTAEGDEEVEFVGSKLHQALNGFSIEVNGKDLDGNKASSSLKQTVEGLSSTVSSISGKSILNQTPESILAAVKTQNANGEAGNEFITSSVSITKDGVAVSTDGTFSVSASDDDESSVVTIDSNGVAIGSTGAFTVHTDKFTVTADGKLSATDAVINGHISNNGYPVLAKNYDLYVGSEPPPDSVLHTGMIWIQPLPESSPDDPEGGGGEVIPSNQEVTFTQLSLFDAHYYLNSSMNGAQTTTLNAASYSSANKDEYTYTATVPLYIARNTNGTKTGGIIKLSLNGVVELSETILFSVSDSKSAQYYTVTMTGKSRVWLGDSSSISAKLSVSRPSSDYYTGCIATSRNDAITVVCN